MMYVQPLFEYKYNLRYKKLEGLARLTKLKIPTVSNLFIISPALYQEFLRTKKLPVNAVSELKTAFNTIKKLGDAIILRNSIYEEENPGIAFCLRNSPNIKNFTVFLRKVEKGYKTVIKSAIDPKKVECSFLIQTFYSSEKCGALLTDNGNGQIFIQAILGQHSDLLLLGDATPDTYTIDKKTYRITSKIIAHKEFRIKKLPSGIKKVRVKKVDRDNSVISNEQAVKLAKLSRKIEMVFGPQQMDWAILDSGEIIFQETRDKEKHTDLRILDDVEIIYPADTEGELIVLDGYKRINNISQKIVATDNLNIAFINKLAFLYRPKAVILTK